MNTGDNYEAQDLRSNFVRFTILFSLNNSIFTTPVVLAPTLLDITAGYWGNALYHFSSCIAALLLGPWIVKTIGLKRTIVCGMATSTYYVALFAAVVYNASLNTGQAVQTRSRFMAFSLGSIFGGLASGTLWTAQGGYFACTAELLAGQIVTPRGKILSSLSGTFAAVHIGTDVGGRLLWTLLHTVGVTHTTIALAFAFVGLVSMLAMAFVFDLKSPFGRVETERSVRRLASSDVPDAASTIGLWKDPVVFLIAGLSATWGFSAAFVFGEISVDFTKADLGTYAVTLFAAFSDTVALVSSLLIKKFDVRLGEALFVVIGALSFFMIGILSLWGGRAWALWRLLSIYTLQGIGRAVHETTNKAMFVDFFPTEFVGAFGNLVLQSSLASALCFIVGYFCDGVALLSTILVCTAFLTPVTYFLALLLRKKQKQNLVRHRWSGNTVDDMGQRSTGVTGRESLASDSGTFVQLGNVK